MDDYRRGTQLDTDLLITYTHNKQLQAIAFNYSVIANFHTLQSNRAHTKSFQRSESSPDVPW
jgi:hypothetical protein